MPGKPRLTVHTKYKLMLQISQRIRDTLDPDEILDHLIDAVGSVIDYDAAGIFVLSEDLVPQPHRRPRQVIAGVARRGFDPGLPEDDAMLSQGLGVVGHVIKTGRAVVIPDVSRDPNYVVGRARTCSEIAVPIVHDERTIGALNLESDRIHAFTDDDVEILRFFGDAAAIVIQRAILHRQLLDQRQLESQLRLAQEVQTGLMPRQAPRLPGYTMAGLCIPTFEIGGDCFDYLPLPGGRLGVIVADVSGKGIPAALLMASFRTLLRVCARSDPRPAALAETTNRRLPEHVARPAFVTAFYGVLDPDSGRFAYVNCGHNPPLLVRADGCVEQLTCGGLPLGVFDDASYSDAAVQIKPGDVLAIYTDGVVENEDDETGDFGAVRLADEIARHRGRPPQEIVETVIAATTRYHGTASYTDDFTLLVLKREFAPVTATV